MPHVMKDSYAKQRQISSNAFASLPRWPKKASIFL